jgi:hypothetical protein
MTISINGEDIGYTLEKETTTGEVLDGIASWLEESGMLVAGVRIDSRKMILADDTWKSIPLEGIQSLEIEAVSVREGRIRQLETARDFFVLLEQSVKNSDAESIRELSSGFEDLKSILSNLSDQGSLPDYQSRMESVLAENGFPGSGTVSTMNPGGVSAEAAIMAEYLEKRLNEAREPETSARNAATELAGIAETLDDVAVNLQTGRDRQAMETIIRMTELLQALMGALSWIGGSIAAEVADELNGLLSELEEGLKAGDTVMIGDLLEYEIKPRLLALQSGRLFTAENAS